MEDVEFTEGKHDMVPSAIIEESLDFTKETTCKDQVDKGNISSILCISIIVDCKE